MKYTSNFFTSYVGLLIVLAVGIYGFYLYKNSPKDEKSAFSNMKLFLGSIGCILYFAGVMVLKIMGKV